MEVWFASVVEPSSDGPIKRPRNRFSSAKMLTSVLLQWQIDDGVNNADISGVSKQAWVQVNLLDSIIQNQSEEYGFWLIYLNFPKTYIVNSNGLFQCLTEWGTQIKQIKETGIFATGKKGIRELVESKLIKLNSSNQQTIRATNSSNEQTCWTTNASNYELAKQGSWLKVGFGWYRWGGTCFGWGWLGQVRLGQVRLG